MSAADYRAIRKWHADTGSMAFYIEAQVAKARRDNAPQDAIYKRHASGEWVTVRDLAADHQFRVWYEASAA